MKCRCGLLTDDPHHFHSCELNGGLWIKRHDLLNFALAGLVRDANLVPFLEPSAHSAARRATGEDIDGKRADLEVVMHGKATLLDVSVTHPCTSTNLAGAATTRLSAARKREQKKDSMYRASSQRDGKYFVPLVFETYGAVTKSVHDFIKRLSGSASSNVDTPPVAFSRRAKAILSITLQKGNCWVMHQR